MVGDFGFTRGSSVVGGSTSTLLVALRKPKPEPDTARPPLPTSRGAPLRCGSARLAPTAKQSRALDRDASVGPETESQPLKSDERGYAGVSLRPMLRSGLICYKWLRLLKIEGFPHKESAPHDLSMLISMRSSPMKVGQGSGKVSVVGAGPAWQRKRLLTSAGADK